MVQGVGDEAHQEQQENLPEQHPALPVGQTDPEPFRRRHAQGEGQHGEEVAAGPAPVSVEQALAQQDDVARLGVGEHPTPAEVGIGVLKSAGESEQRHRKQPLGGGMCLLIHTIISLCLKSSDYNAGVPKRKEKNSLQKSCVSVILSPSQI